MTILRVPVVPVGKPRMTQRDKWKRRPCVVQYYAFADALRAYTQKLRFILPDAGVHIEFEIPMPRSWSPKKRAEMVGQPHQQKPDIDNLLKAVLDVMRGEDCTVWSIAGLEKRWSDSGSINFEIRERRIAA